MKKQNKIFTLSALVSLGGFLLYPLLRGSSKKETKNLEMRSVDYPELIKNIRGKSYCEIFMGYRIFRKFKIGIYNNIKRRSIPVSEWDQFNLIKLKEETGAYEIIKNGPRFWVLDGIRGYQSGESRFLCGYEFDLVGFIEKDISELKNDLNVRKLYSENKIERYTDWFFNKGEKIFELVSPGNIIYSMQSASQEVDKNQSLSDLDSLSEKLSLPEGWNYRVRILEEDVCFKIRGEAHVIQDDMKNTYQRNPY